MKNQVTPGSLWRTTDRFFRVISVNEVNGNTWVHYREDLGIKVPVLECKEYSCYLESFLERFSKAVE